MSRLFSCHRFPWTAPLLPQLVDFLLPQSTTDDPLTLDHLLIIIPTRQSGRRLLETLTLAAHQINKGLLPPLILTPDALLRMACPHSVASKTLAVVTWADLLKEKKEAITTLLPNTHLTDDSWALQTARQLERVQSQIGLHGLDFSQVAVKTKNTTMDPKRWQLLAELEDLYRKRLRDMDKLCPQQALTHAATNPVLPAAIRHILLASPSPSPLVIQLLQTVQQQGLDCTVLQYGPDTPEAWNEQGLPDPQFWHQHDLELTETHSFHVSHDPHELASTLCQRLLSSPVESQCAIGIPDTQLLPAIEQELSSLDLVSYNPAGQSLHYSEAGRLLLAIQDFLLQTQFHATWNLLRHPAFYQEVLRDSQLPRGSSPQRLLAEVDKLEERHLCHSMDSLNNILESHPTRFPCMQAALPHLAAWQQMAKQEYPEQALEHILLQFIGDRVLIPANPEDRAFITALQELNDILQQIRDLRLHYPDITQTTLYSLLGSLLQETTLYAERPANAVDLQGWLEILWDPAPYLILAGMHNQALPMHIQGDAFLPEQLRNHIGMETNLQRSSMDAYLLHSVLACRRETGRVEMLLARWGVDNQAIYPSPLLLRTKDDPALLQRIRDLIQYQPPLPKLPQRTIPPLAHLNKPNTTGKKISVTAFKAWLNNPFDFLLQYLLGWETRTHRKQEMDGSDIGNLIHYTMEKCVPLFYKQELDLKETTELFESHAREQLEILHGSHPHFLLELQWDNIKRRLYHCAAIETQLKKEGWTNQYIEQKLSFPLQGYQVEGRIDRIDYHKERNAYRVIDYKTSSADYAYSKKIISRTGPLLLPEIEFVRNERGKPVRHRWTDLQLPLYAHAVQHAYQLSGDLEVCVFSIPSTLGKIKLHQEIMTPELVQPALQCACAILQSIDNNHFWAQRESRHFSEFFPDGVEQMLDLQHLSFPESEDIDHTQPLT